MSNGNTVYGEIEIGLHQVLPEAIEVELRITDPNTQGEITPARGQARISPEKLLEELLEWEVEPQQYGETLASYIFQDAAIRKLYNESKAAFERGGQMLRLRVLVGDSAAKLHSVRWELLCDPETKRSLATSERILFSRFMLSQDWRVIKLRPKAELKALIAVAAPADLARFQLADVDKQGEIARAREALAGIQAAVVGQDEPLTLNRLIDSIRRGVDVLYLVCHGAFPREKQEPMLFLQDEDGNTAIVKASDLAHHINELAETPRLIVLASCESAGREDGAAAADGTPATQSALAPRLAQAGVPSVIAMQGKISMETVKRAMPTFFRELLIDGQIDRAMAAARGAVRQQDDGWMPALFTRLKDGRIWSEPQEAPNRILHLPFAQNRFFTGRDELLKDLRNSFESGESVQALNGLGGIGKTQAAAEYAYRHLDSYRMVLWAQAQTRESLVTDFVSMAALLDLPEKNAQDQNEVVNAMKRWLANNSGWLLILDNADDLKMAREFIPANKNGHVLLTTRAQNVGDIAVRNPVQKMNLAEGAFFLLRKIGKLTKEEMLESASPESRQQAEALTKELDGLPLALDQAAAFIVEMPSSLEQYLRLYATERAELLAHRGELTQNHPSVAVTFSLAFKQVEQASAAAADLLRVCAFLESDAIPMEIFSDGGSELGESLSAIAQSLLKLTKAIAEASRFSLLQSDPEVNTLSLHRLVQEVLIAEMDGPTRKTWAERAVRAVNAAFPNDVEFSEWKICGLLVPHAQKLAGTIEREGFEFQQASRLLNQTASYLHDRAQYAEAESLIRRALQIDEQSFGPEHPSIGIRLNNLAQLLQAMNRMAEAEPLMRRALKIDEQSFGPEHPDVGIRLNNLAQLLKVTNRMAEAEPLMRRALKIDEQSFGPEHPAVGRDLNNLAQLLKDTNRMAEAEPLMRRAVTIFENSLGSDHPNTLIVRGNYALLLQAIEQKGR